VSICLVFAGIHIAQAEEEVENLLENPDFEDFGNAPWTMWVEDQGNAMAFMNIDEKESLTGEQSLRIDITMKGGGMRVELHQNPIFVEKGLKLTYAFWAKVEKDDVREARMIMNHRNPPWTAYGSKAIKITDEWTEFWVACNIPVDDPIAGIYVELRDTVGKIWFDRFRLYEGEYFEEDFEEKPDDMAVEPHGKLVSTWAGLKAVR